MPEVRQLDREYLPEEGVPDYPHYVERFAQTSERYKGSLPPARRPSRAYGAHPLAIADYYLPQGIGPHPAILFVHGGYWKRASRPARAFLAERYNERGIAWVNVGYPIVPDVSLETVTQHAEDGLAFVLDHADEMGLDAARIAVCGNSAGAHLVAHSLSGERFERWPISGAALVSGLYDLRPLEALSPNDWLRLDATRYAALSPQLADRVPAVPLQVSVGGLESDAFKAQSMTYANEIRARGAAVDFVEVPGVHHFSIAETFADPDSMIGAALCRWISGRNRGSSI